MAQGLFEIVDPRFGACVNGSAKLEKLYGDCAWAEGPAYFPAHRQLVWSDIPNDRMLRFDEVTGQVGVFRQPAGYSNGNTVDRQGRLVTCEHGGRRVVRIEPDGALTVIADAYDGKRLNSPNDVVVRSDGSIWFTDPAYGIETWYEGHRTEPEQDGCHVYRVSPEGMIERVADDFVRPNGIAFSPDEQSLYVADTGGTHFADGPRHIRVFKVDAAGALSGGGVFAELTDGFFDGFRCDEEGRLWTSAGEGVNVYAPDGALLGRIHVGETVSNLCFGGPKRNRLYITATTSLYAMLLPVRGAKTF